MNVIVRPWLALAPVGLFLLLAGFHLDRPGLHYDEALEGGLPAVQLLNGQQVTPLNGVALHIGGRTLPLMVQNHIGAVQVYAALPFIRFGGPQAASLRTMTVVAGAVTLIAVYLFVAQIYRWPAAFYSSMWLASFASFVFWSRQGVFVTSLVSCFAMLALAAGAYWWRTGRLWAIGLAGICMGLAVYSKLSALWLANGLIAWWLLSTCTAWVRARWSRQIQRQSVNAIVWAGVQRDMPGSVPMLPWRALGIGLAGLLLGVWPLILYNLRSGAATLQVVERSATQTYLGQNNTEVLRNLQTRVVQAADVVRSGDHLWYLGGSFRNSVALASVLVALLILVVICLHERGRSWRSTLLVPFLALMVIVQSCFTISALWPTHFAVGVPLPAMIFGIAAGRVQSWSALVGSRARKRVRWLVTFLAVMVIVAQALTSLSYLRAVTTSGGLSFHSASIYDLSRFLENRPEHIVALDWGISAQVAYLSGGRKEVEELYDFQPELPSFATELRERFNRDELYITHATGQEAFPHRAAFLQAVADAGMWAERVNTFMGANGVPELELWRVRRP